MVLRVVLSETFDDGENETNIGGDVMVTAPLVAEPGMDVILSKTVEDSVAEA